MTVVIGNSCSVEGREEGRAGGMEKVIMRGKMLRETVKGRRGEMEQDCILCT